MNDKILLPLKRIWGQGNLSVKNCFVCQVIAPFKVVHTYQFAELLKKKRPPGEIEKKIHLNGVSIFTKLIVDRV